MDLRVHFRRHCTQRKFPSKSQSGLVEWREIEELTLGLRCGAYHSSTIICYYYLSHVFVLSVIVCVIQVCCTQNGFKLSRLGFCLFIPYDVNFSWGTFLEANNTAACFSNSTTRAVWHLSRSTTYACHWYYCRKSLSSASTQQSGIDNPRML